MKKILFICIALLLISCKKDELYTHDECVKLKNGDTIYVNNMYSYKKYIVLKNIPIKELIEVRNLEYYWDIDILSYEDFRFKNK